MGGASPRQRSHLGLRRARELPKEAKVIAREGAQVVYAGAHHDEALDTETKGIDLVATYNAALLGGESSLSLAFNNNQTEVTRFNPDTLNAARIRQLEEGLPETRWSLTGTQSYGPLRLLAREGRGRADGRGGGARHPAVWPRGS